MPILRRALAVTAVAAASTITFALPASAHTPRFQPSCDSVTIHLTQFSTKGDNTVHVLRAGQEIQDPTVSPRTFRGSTDIVVPEDWSTDTVEYKVTWNKGDLFDGFTDHGRMFFKDTLHKPEGCETEPTPTPTPTDEPTATPSPTLPGEEPSETPEPSMTPSAPVTEAPTAAPSSSAAAVQGAKLANTGAGNTVPMVIIGAVLVAGGVGLTFVTRRRRSASSAS